MKLKFNKILFALVSVSVMAGCTPNISPDVVQAGNANEVTTTVQGKVISMRTVTVKGNDNTVGMLAGGAAGAVAGSAIGQGRGSLLGAIGGAVLGGTAGSFAQDKLSTQQGIEYIVKLDNGKMLTVVQGAGAQNYTVGQCVYVIEGGHARIVGGC
jgi:outer membrane lipoprotein SlyB